MALRSDWLLMILRISRIRQESLVFVLPRQFIPIGLDESTNKYKEKLYITYKYPNAKNSIMSKESNKKRAI
jgi:hypothetical protein